MKKQHIIRGGIILSIISVLTVPAFAEIKTVSLRVDGLSCPFCALGLEKKLKKVESVSGVNVHMKKALTDLTLKPQSALDLKAIRKAVKEAGFTLKNIDVGVLGTIIRDNEGFFVLESQGDKTRFILFDKEHSEARAKSLSTQMLGNDIEKKLLQAQNDGKLVLIQGTIHEHAELPPGLLINRVEVQQ